MIPLNDGNKEHIIQIGSKLKKVIKKYLIFFLQENVDVFIWTLVDMSGIDLEVMTHRLSINPNYQPIKQKKINFMSERQKAIMEEVDKLLNVGFIWEVTNSS